MFHLYQHHDLEVLAEAARRPARAGRPVLVLEPDTILVPNRGTARWLQAQLAGSERHRAPTWT
ncbi:MAG: exodeoxyribonuclease V subunit gamma [Halofilum sp. (in: g-proteobacteria)]|nr:exodeoxyribonuclease V subunit gamma [Halofilum sp. (in: g-proteobacteria)]